MKLNSTSLSIRVLIFSMSLLCLTKQGLGQNTGLYYSNTNNTAAYGAIAGTVVHAAGTDDAISAAIAMNMTFKLGGEPFTQLWISSNGWVSLQNPAGNSYPSNNLATTTIPIIAPFWDDLKCSPVNGNVRYQSITVGGQKIFKVEWQNMRWNNLANDSSVSFQLWLYGDTAAVPATSNQIRFQYLRLTNVFPLVSPSASAGFSGLCPGDFYADSTNGASGPSLVFSKLADPANQISKFTNLQFCQFNPLVHPNDWAANAQNTPLVPSLSIQQFSGSTFHSTKSTTVALPACWTAADTFDVWFKIIKPAGITNFEIFTDQQDCRGAAYNPKIAVYKDTTAAPIACDATNSAAVAGATASIYFTNQLCTSDTYWIRVGTSKRAYFRFNIRPPGRNCTYANNITPCGIPYTAPTGLSTCNFGNDYDSTVSACHSSYNKGEDYVFSYTPPATICADFHLANTPTNSFPALFIYNGCPSTGNCLGSITGAGGAAAMNFNNITLAMGNTYYFVVEYDSTNLTPCLSAFDFSITFNATSPPVYDNCGSAPNVPVNISVSSSCTGGIPYYNSCATPSAAGTVPVPACGNFTDGVTPDVWFRFTSTAAVQAHTINVNPMFAAGDAQDLCMQIYSGTCPGALVPLAGACDDNSSGFNMPSLTFVPPSTSTQYYIRIWSNDGTQPGNFNICAIVGCTPANDLPCNAINLTLGIATTGDNACSSNAGEPAALPGCWDAGVQNTVWYKFTPAFTGNVRIRTRLFSLFDSQIAVYTGACGPGLVLAAGTNCNNDITEGCAGALRTYRHSVIDPFPVTSGTTYYVRLDGRASNTGTFEILVIDATQPLPPIPLQDCVVAQVICSNTSFTVADPGYQGIGHYCDLAAAPGCFIGERSSAWYLVSIQNPAPGGSYFQFSINPFAGTDYDFFVWRVDGVANYCSILNTYASFPWYRGSWTDTYGPTGVSLSAGSGTTSQCIGGVGPAFHPAYPVTGGETFLILVSNWWGNTSGFQMDWLGTPISGTPPVRYWQNATTTAWTTTTNWTPLCGNVPDCPNQIGAIITNVGAVQPLISASTSVKDITINSGATLTLGINVKLSVCGDFTNNGTLTCAAGSTVEFTGAAALQTISGTFSFIPSNSFPNFTVNKPSGSVILNTNIYISGIDSIKNGILNNNLKNTFLKGNFYNYNGATSFTNMGAGVGGSTFNFVGAAPQNYINLANNLTLNNVTINQSPASTVVLASGAFNDMILGTSGALTLTSGVINTGAAQKVDITNSAAAAVSAGNVSSYVENLMRRAIPAATLGTYEFPLGITPKGYQRFSLQYTATASSAYTITGKFSVWAALPATGPNVTECISANYSCCAPYDNGYWTMDASIGSGFGTYTANAYPLNVTNDIGGAPNGYSIMKSVSNNGGGPWLMLGNCVTPGMGVNPVSRTALTSFSDFGIVQFVSPLPIELLNFDAEQSLDETVLTSWATATEINNDHFEVERSADGSSNFKSIGTVKGFGAGTTTSNHYYSLRDQEQCTGLNYYRLKQTDIDGKFSYSNVVAVRCREKSDLVSVYPNPSNTKINVSFYEIADGKLSIEILDMFGNVISSTAFSVAKDLNNVEMKIEQLANGFYYLRLKNTDTGSETSRQVRFLKY